MTDDAIPVGDHEDLYRRIPLSQEDLIVGENQVDPEAFHPNKKRDAEGISLSRSALTTPEEDAARGRGPSYYIVVIPVAALIEENVTIQPDPIPDNTAHVLLPQLNADNRRSVECTELKFFLAQSVSQVLGPFPGQSADG